MNYSFAGLSAIVTGAGTGIGRLVALRLARSGARVAVLDLDAAAARDAALQIGAGTLALRCDVAREADVAAATEAVASAFGGIDVLINNAGLTRPGLCADTTLAAWEQTLAVNLTGTFLCSRYALPHMIARGGGAIVNLTTVATVAAVGNRAPYAAAKAGIVGLTRSIAYDYGPLGVRCNALYPATTRTPLIDRAADYAPDPAAFRRYIARRQFVQRIAEPEEVAGAVLFLASPEARSIQGVHLAVDGGLTATWAAPAESHRDLHAI